MISKEQIFSATNGGLDIILSYYPSARNVLEGNAKHFAIRDERTPSASIRNFSGIWKVTDFGGDGGARDAISICMEEEGLNFPQALNFLADRYGIEGITSSINKPKVTERKATNKEKDGDLLYELNPSISDAECLVMVPLPNQLEKIRTALERYGWCSVKSYSKVKNGIVKTFHSTDTYPIFMRVCPNGDTPFRKFYIPLNPDKSFRFFYHGDKPVNYINGLIELSASYAKLEAVAMAEYDEERARHEGAKYTAPKMDDKDNGSAVIICSGERDAICAAVMGYYPLWFNSETAKLSIEDWSKISRYSNIVYNIPDVDNTGRKAAIKLGMQFLDLYTVWLPESLTSFKDMRGRPRKDFRDYIELNPKRQNIENLLKLAKPMRFWEYAQSGREGTIKRLEINPEYLIHFLSCNGFATMENKNVSDGQMLVRIEKNVVREITPKDIRAYLLNFVRERGNTIQLINLVHTSNRITKDLFYSLGEVKLDFTDYSIDNQLFFFENATVKVSGDSIDILKDKVSSYVWQDEVIPHKIKPLPQSFTVSENGDLEILNLSSNFFKVLIQTSRVHWRAELENNLESLPEEEKLAYISAHKFDISGPNLTPIQIAEQKQHLLNKIFTIGYLLHRYKSDSRAWCVFAMDAKIDMKNNSNGRSGKSFCFNFLGNFMRTTTLSGRNSKITDNSHIFERVTEHTDFVLIDDANYYLDFDYFFPAITGRIEVNPKHGRSYEIPFNQSPKFCITSNYVLRKSDPSTEGRLLYTVFSDYYHQKREEDDYKEQRSIYDDFGKDLFKDSYSEQEWCADIYFIMECCKYYLSVAGKQKICPPMENVLSRIQIQRMGGQVFADWADVYFDPNGSAVNTRVRRADAYSHFIVEAAVPTKTWTPHRWKDALKTYCQYKGYIFNPPQQTDSSGRIIARDPMLGITIEYIYISTTVL